MHKKYQTASNFLSFIQLLHSGRDFFQTHFLFDENCHEALRHTEFLTFERAYGNNLNSGDNRAYWNWFLIRLSRY